MTFHPIFKEGASESVSPFTAEPGQLKAQALGLIQLHSQDLNLLTCSLPGYRFSAHVSCPLVSWQVPTSPGPFSGRGLGILFEMYSFYAGCSSGSPCEINRGQMLWSVALCRSLANLPGQRSRAVLALPVLEAPGHGFPSLAVSRSLKRTQVASCTYSLVGSRLLRVGPRNLYVKKSCPVGS